MHFFYFASDKERSNLKLNFFHLHFMLIINNATKLERFQNTLFPVLFNSKSIADDSFIGYLTIFSRTCHVAKITFGTDNIKLRGKFFLSRSLYCSFWMWWIFFNILKFSLFFFFAKFFFYIFYDWKLNLLLLSDKKQSEKKFL